MPKYHVTLILQREVVIEVDAESEREAIQQALDEEGCEISESPDEVIKDYTTASLAPETE